jgi:hypothetical protein
VFRRNVAPPRRSNAFVLGVVGVGCLGVGALLIGLSAIGVPVSSGRPLTYAVVLPPIGVVFLMASLVSYLRHRRD